MNILRKTRHHRIRCAVFCLAVLATASACAESGPVTETQALSGTLSCRLSVAGSLQHGQPFTAGLALHNGMATLVEVLRYLTPFEGILGEIFDIRRQGEPVPYEGPMVKRAAPGDADWLALPAGQELYATVDPSEAWDLTQPGEYQLQLRNSIIYRVPGEAEPRQLDAAGCGVVVFTF
jgi:peptidyl-Lys metalloendopeptidase